MIPESPRARAPVLYRALLETGASHLVGLPDSRSAALFRQIDEDGNEDGGMVSVRVTREGEAFAVAAGLWIGGARPVLSIQNTGLLESGDALRGTVNRIGIPLLCVVGYRGWEKLRRWRGEAGSGGDDAGTRDDDAGSVPEEDRSSPEEDRLEPDGDTEILRRPDVDSVALLTEPTLEAWRVPFLQYRGDGDVDRVGELWDRARREGRAAALLLTRRLTSGQGGPC